jgi:hypothetical protein
VDGGWWEGQFGDKTGWFPNNHVTQLMPESITHKAEPSTATAAAAAGSTTRTTVTGLREEGVTRTIGHSAPHTVTPITHTTPTTTTITVGSSLAGATTTAAVLTASHARPHPAVAVLVEERLRVRGSVFDRNSQFPAIKSHDYWV